MNKTCTECKIDKALDDYRNDSRGKFGKEAKCKDCRRKYSKNYYLDNKKYYGDYYKEWSKNNKDKVIAKDEKRKDTKSRKTYVSNYKKLRRKEDELFRIKDNIRNLIYCAFTNKGYNKNSKTMDVLGIDINGLIKHLNNNDYGFCCGQEGLDVDHITPLSTANNEEDIYKLNHYTNLQLLPSKYNQHIKRDGEWDKNHFENWNNS